MYSYRMFVWVKKKLLLSYAPSVSCRKRKRSLRKTVKNITPRWRNTSISLPRRRRRSCRRWRWSHSGHNEAVWYLVLILIVLLRLMKSWIKSGSTSTSRRWNTSTRSIRCKTGRSSTWWNLWVLVISLSYRVFELDQTLLSVSGAGVPSQHFNAQQPDSGDDSGLHALQTRAAAQPAERERPFWERCSPSHVISSNWTSVRF